MPPKTLPLPSADLLRSLFSYDPGTGTLFWKKLPSRSKRCLLGRPVGTMGSGGYLSVKIGKVSYRVHRVVWKMMTGVDPVEILDHKNGRKTDNRFENLRPATSAQNGQNR